MNGALRLIKKALLLRLKLKIERNEQPEKNLEKKMMKHFSYPCIRNEEWVSKKESSVG